MEQKVHEPSPEPPRRATSLADFLGWRIVFVLPLTPPDVLVHCHRGEGVTFECRMMISEARFVTVDEWIRVL